MKLKFTKMHGCGNDYIYFNCFNQTINDPASLSVELSDRRFGIGGDGIILICPSEVADGKMRMFNLDGSEGRMCGNGIRCVGKFLYDEGFIKKNKITIETLSGVREVEVVMKDSDGKAEFLTVNMGRAELDPKKIPVEINKDKFNFDKIVNYPVNVENKNYNITCVSMGNPHCVVFCADLDNLNLEKIGPKFENNQMFPQKVNTEFVKVIDKNMIEMRVWERGSGETLACGTGACAAVVASVLNGFCLKNDEITVKLRGGILKIKYTDVAVYMTGEAVKVFEGVVNV